MRPGKRKRKQTSGEVVCVCSPGPPGRKFMGSPSLNCSASYLTEKPPKVSPGASATGSGFAPGMLPRFYYRLPRLRPDCSGNTTLSRMSRVRKRQLDQPSRTLSVRRRMSAQRRWAARKNRDSDQGVNRQELNSSPKRSKGFKTTVIWPGSAASGSVKRIHPSREIPGKSSPASYCSYPGRLPKKES